MEGSSTELTNADVCCLTFLHYAKHKQSPFYATDIYLEWSPRLSFKLKDSYWEFLMFSYKMMKQKQVQEIKKEKNA